MMTQPIQTFQNLTSETAGGNAFTQTSFAHVDRQQIEREARRARSGAVAGLIRLLARQAKRLAVAAKADFKLRAAEAQLYRMSDRELADLGLCRADIPFAVREPIEGVMPQFDTIVGHHTAANQNARRAA